MKKYLFILIIAIVAGSCKKEVSEPLEMGYDYAPLEEGYYIIYNVDSITYDPFISNPEEAKDTVRFQLKEKFDDIFTDLEGRETYTLYRYKRPRVDSNQEGQTWVLSDVWSVNKFTETYQRIEENERFSRLKFPMKEESTWDGNAFNTRETWDYTYQDVHASLTQDDNTWDSTVTVIQNSFESNINIQNYFEIYGKHRGLIRKYIMDLEQEGTSINPSIPLLDRVNKGIIYDQRYVSHGVEN